MSQVAKINIYVDATKIVGNPLLPEVYEILKIIRPGWRAESIEPKKFTDGITNLLMGYYEKGKFDEDVILLRIYGEGTEMMIDRNLEKKNVLVLSEAGCCPPLYAEFNNGIAYGFVHGQTLEPDTVRDDRVKRLIAEEMCRMHYVKPEGMEPKPQLFIKLQKFLNIYPDHLDTPEKQKRFVELLPSKDKILEDFSLLKSQLEALNCEIVFSHNDLLLKNIIYSKEKDKVTFIDHEYAMFNYQPHDIANHFCEYAGVDDVDFSRYPGKEYQLDWIRHYLVCWEEINGRPGSGVTDRDVEEMYVKVNKFALASHFFWATWSIIQAKYSKIDFDFLGYGIMKFNEFLACKDEFLSLKLPD
ncbi:hypothetical protein ACJMK2_020166 [Sinanodonta woodiana]|uniref:ethanolamine kinase n=1 Tax=Sinanodonta woodiana TaxID=1069815 RepID=A0ABD3TY81_SINWO